MMSAIGSVIDRSSISHRPEPALVDDPPNVKTLSWRSGPPLTKRTKRGLPCVATGAPGPSGGAISPAGIPSDQGEQARHAREGIGQDQHPDGHDEDPRYDLQRTMVATEQVEQWPDTRQCDRGGQE